MAKVAWTIISNQATERGVLAKRHVFKLYSDRFHRLKARVLLFYFALSDLLDRGCFFQYYIYLQYTQTEYMVDEIMEKIWPHIFTIDFKT